MSEEIKMEDNQSNQNKPVDQPKEVQSQQNKSLQDRLFEEKPQKKGPKFSIYWVYALILAALVGSTLFGNGLSDTKITLYLIVFRTKGIFLISKNRINSSLFPYPNISI